MKNLRVVILILLAFLLPVRGALATAMLCPGGSEGDTAIMAVEQGHVATHAERGLHDEHAGEHHPSSGDLSDHDASASAEHPPACQVCASGCCVTPLAFAPPSVAATMLTISVAFPALSGPIPAFHSGGQDRPPRTI